MLFVGDLGSAFSATERPGFPADRHHQFIFDAVGRVSYGLDFPAVAKRLPAVEDNAQGQKQLGQRLNPFQHGVTQRGGDTAPLSRTCRGSRCWCRDSRRVTRRATGPPQRPEPV